VQTSYPGLSEAEALARSKAFGPNALAPIRSRGTARIIVGTLREPMFLLLVVASVLYLLIGNLGEGLFLTRAAAATVGLVVVQEARSERALEALRDLSAPNVRLIRGGTERVASVTTLVPGDIILVGEGQRVPADGRLVLSASSSGPPVRVIWTGGWRTSRPRNWRCWIRRRSGQMSRPGPRRRW
jgi:Ca2+-transporting ATPase